MPLGSSCASIAQQNTRIESLPFNVSVDPRGFLSVSGCDGGEISFATEHEIPNGTDHWLAAPRTVLPPNSTRIQLTFPTSFVYVWCQSLASSLSSTVETNDALPPLFLAVHTPVPAELLQSRPIPEPAHGQSARSPKQRRPHRRNIFILQLDAISAHKLPILMPRTYALLESLRLQSENSHQEHQVRGATRTHSSDDQMIALRYNKMGLVGPNSAPFFLALMGHTRDYNQAADHPSWLWVAAQKQGYITGIGETACSLWKYSLASLFVDQKRCSPWIDHGKSRYAYDMWPNLYEKPDGEFWRNYKDRRKYCSMNSTERTRPIS